MTNSHHDISAFLADYAKRLPLLDAEALGVQLYGAPRLNSFAMFGPDERRVTNILADLLDPKGRHGQGTLFLNAFLAQAGLEKVRRDDAVTVTVDEVTAAGRLVDLVVSTPAALLGIEVKLWAAQQDNQLQDYLKHLESNTGPNRSFKLVFLAEQEPLTAKKEVLRMPWTTDGESHWARPVRSILAGVLPEVRAARTRAFLEDFLVWIDESFGGVSVNAGEFRPHLDAVTEAYDFVVNRRAIGAIMMAQDSLHRKVIKAIEEAILKNLPSEFKTVKDEDLFRGIEEKGYAWQGFMPHWPENVFLSIEADKSNFGRIFFGIEAPSADHRGIDPEDVCQMRNVISQGLTKHGMNGKISSWWAYYEDMQGPYNHWNAEFAGRILMEAPHGRIEQHTEIEALAKKMCNLFDVLDAILADNDRALVA